MLPEEDTEHVEVEDVDNLSEIGDEEG